MDVVDFTRDFDTGPPNSKMESVNDQVRLDGMGDKLAKNII